MELVGLIRILTILVFLDEFDFQLILKFIFLIIESLLWSSSCQFYLVEMTTSRAIRKIHWTCGEPLIYSIYFGNPPYYRVPQIIEKSAGISVSWQVVGDVSDECNERSRQLIVKAVSLHLLKLLL